MIPSPTQTSNVPSHSNVVEAVCGSLHLSRVALCRVLLSKDLLLTKLGTVVKVYFSIKTDHWKKRGREGERREERGERGRREEREKGGNRNRGLMCLRGGVKRYGKVE